MVKITLLSSLNLLLFSLLFFFHFASSSSLPSSASLPILSLTNPRKINPNLTASTCTYRVEISTSCSSKAYTRDKISLSFGDRYGGQVYVERIDDPSSLTFEACSTDTFDIYGPCTYDVCYVYLYRHGSDGWKVGSVHISGQYTRSVTFNYNEWIPNDVWYGFNYCSGSSSQGLRIPSLTTLFTIISASLLLVLEGHSL